MLSTEAKSADSLAAVRCNDVKSSERRSRVSSAARKWFDFFPSGLPY